MFLGLGFRGCFFSHVFFNHKIILGCFFVFFFCIFVVFFWLCVRMFVESCFFFWMFYFILFFK